MRSNLYNHLPLSNLPDRKASCSQLLNLCIGSLDNQPGKFLRSRFQNGPAVSRWLKTLAPMLINPKPNAWVKTGKHSLVSWVSVADWVLHLLLLRMKFLFNLSTHLIPTILKYNQIYKPIYPIFLLAQHSPSFYLLPCSFHSQFCKMCSVVLLVFYYKLTP